VNKSEILDVILAARSPVTKREIARALGLKGSGSRVELKKMLRALEDEGAIIKQAGGGYSPPAGLDGVIVLEVTDLDIDGDVFAKPVDWNESAQGTPPRIEVKPDKKGHASVSPGDRVLARLNRLPENQYEAVVIRKMDAPKNRVMGLVKILKGGAVLQPANKKVRDEFQILDLKSAKDGDLAVAEFQPSRSFRDKKVKIVEVIGKRGDAKAISLISLYEAGINPQFPDAAISATKNMSVPSPENREDLRDIPLVTIDGIDAKDFDDAVFAEKTDEGFHLIVAIADVAYYVRPETALDTEAQRRGNSTYFPDRVVPMLPEALSNDLCSLRPHEPRACLAAHMWIDNEGKLTKYKFVRGLMKSAARLTYEQVQAAQDGTTDSTTKPLLKSVIGPLYEAFKVLDDARRGRGALDLDLPERKVILDDQGNMTGVTKRLRLDSHKLIEEFMVLANVAAATALEAKKAPCVYRIHDRPSPEKLDSAREFVESFGLSLPKGAVAEPKQLNQILLQAAKLPYSHLISLVMLRCQSQAHYSPENIGHFGLALHRYAHFTSPIRRYADLLIHRSLIAAYNLGPGGIDKGEVARLEEICENISATERTSMEAERNSIDRFAAAYLSQSIGAEFAGRINGVTRFGLFIELEESGADGLVPIRSLPSDFYIHDERAHALIGRRSNRVFRLGAPVTVRLMEADGLTGSTLLNLVGHEHGADIPGMELKVRNRGSDRPDRGKGGKPRKNKKNFKKKGRRR
jgi:ribonuclease R